MDAHDEPEEYPYDVLDSLPKLVRCKTVRFRPESYPADSVSSLPEVPDPPTGRDLNHTARQYEAAEQLRESFATESRPPDDSTSSNEGPEKYEAIEGLLESFPTERPPSDKRTTDEVLGNACRYLGLQKAVTFQEISNILTKAPMFTKEIQARAQEDYGEGGNTENTAKQFLADLRWLLEEEKRNDQLQKVKELHLGE